MWGHIELPIFRCHSCRCRVGVRIECGAADHSTQITVSVLDAEHGGIYVVYTDGTVKRRLTTGSSDMLPRWSPDGKQIAFLALREQDHEMAAEHDLGFHWSLYVMDADGRNQRQVTETPIGMIFQWSPDGSRFVFESPHQDGNNKAKDGTVSSAIYVMKADGTQQKRLTPVENNDGVPSWSPDSKQIASCLNRYDNMDIFVKNADGSDVRRMTSNGANDIGPTCDSMMRMLVDTVSVLCFENALVVRNNSSKKGVFLLFQRILLIFRFLLKQLDSSELSCGDGKKR